MTGRVLREGPPAPHSCDPPDLFPLPELSGDGSIVDDDDPIVELPERQHSPGTVWRCDCGRRWVCDGCGWRRARWPSWLSRRDVR